MRKTIAALLTVLVLVSCKDKNAYTISGTMDNAGENLKAYISKDQGQSFVDSALVKDGRFVFSGIQEEPKMLMLGILTQEKQLAASPMYFFLEAGDVKITIKDNASIVSGTALNDKYANMEAKAVALGNGAESLTYIKTALVENADNAIAEFVLPLLSPSLKPQEIMEIIAAMPEKTKNKDEIKTIKQEAEQALTQSNIGKTYKDIKGLSIDGKEVLLSDYAGKGKVVLLDFWASWCGPCITELPTVKEAYVKYKDKGFEIVGVSLDEDAKAWAAATKKHGVTWPQFSSLKGWKDPAAAVYNVESIPYTILIDKDGTMIEENLRGSRLSQKLAELLDK